MTVPPTAELRIVLEHLADSTPAIDQPALLAKLVSTFPHSIVSAPSPFTPVHPIASYNCFEFALGIAGRKEVSLISEFIPSTCCNGEFVAYLAKSTLVPVASAADNDLVLYHDGQQYTHAGLVHGDRVLSKWGNGLLWLHGMLEVPANYGNTTSYYRATNPEEALAKFLEFARVREGVTLVNEIITFSPPSNADA